MNDGASPPAASRSGKGHGGARVPGEAVLEDGQGRNCHSEPLLIRFRALWKGLAMYTEYETWGRKDKILVEIIKIDGSVIRGKVFVTPNERVSELFTNNKLFLPFETEAGAFEVIAKETIARATPLEDDRPLIATTRLDPTAMDVVLVDGTEERLSFFLRDRQRVVDVLNNDQTFLPVLSELGELSIINKITIDRVRPAASD